MSPKILFISFFSCLLWFCFISSLPDVRVTKWLHVPLNYTLPYPHLLTKDITQRMKNLYPQRFPTMSPGILLAWTNLCDQGEWMGWFTFPMSYTSPRELILNGQPTPRTCREGKGAWCWECNPQKSTLVAIELVFVFSWSTIPHHLPRNNVHDGSKRRVKRKRTVIKLQAQLVGI